jgi:hypothetical protein
MNVQMKVDKLRTFITRLLVHMHQKKKSAVEIAAKIVSVNWPLLWQCYDNKRPRIQYCIKGLNNLNNKIFASMISC